jgi:hypothetical protein
MQNHVVKLLKEKKKLAAILGDDECKTIVAEVRKIAEKLHTNSVSDAVLSECTL